MSQRYKVNMKLSMMVAVHNKFMCVQCSGNILPHGCLKGQSCSALWRFRIS